jgi:hypothetical protein
MAFLDELTGDFVVHLRTPSSISTLVGAGTAARIYPEMARQGAALPHIVYTQAAGEALKTHSGRSGCKEVTLHVYCYSETQPQSRALAELVEAYMLDTSGPVASGQTKIQVCNGGIVDSGVEPAINSSDRKKFWVRLVLRMLIG